MQALSTAHKVRPRRNNLYIKVLKSACLRTCVTDCLRRGANWQGGAEKGKG